MMSNTSSPRGDVENAMLQLQQQLNSNYLAAEKLMLLRNPDKSKLRDLSAKIRVVNLGPVYTIPGSGFPGILDL